MLLGDFYGCITLQQVFQFAGFAVYITLLGIRGQQLQYASSVSAFRRKLSSHQAAEPQPFGAAENRIRHNHKLSLHDTP